jgi:hypothetical protein
MREGRNCQDGKSDQRKRIVMTKAKHLAERCVRGPGQILRGTQNDNVMAEVDIPRKRIVLSMKAALNGKA